MNIRCSNPNSKSYPRYGGRGIRVCGRWQKSFALFLEDMGPKPSPAHSIERENTNGNYEPGNCRWATTVEQNRNKTSSKLTVEKVAQIRELLAAGHTQRSVAKRFGVSSGMVSHIHNRTAWT